MRSFWLLGLLATMARDAALAQRGPFRIGTVTAAPGSMVHGVLRVEPTALDAGATLPIAVFHGAAAGPTIAIMAGIHGSEYPPILALQDLRGRLHPDSVRGTIVLVLLANPRAFFHRTVYYTPDDWKNLNRSFPGDASGTLASRIADALVREVFASADIVVDCHAGDANEELLSYAVAVQAGDPLRDRRALELATALGFPRLITPRLPTPPPSPTRFASRTAAAMGKVAVAIESGEMGRRDAHYVTAITDGLINLLRASGNLPGTPLPPARPAQRFGGTKSVEATTSGILWPRPLLGRRVALGDTLAVVTALTGDTLEVVRVPASGIVLYQAMTPPITAGETVGSVGLPEAP